MASDLRGELRQRKPFATRQEEAALNLARSAAVLHAAFEEVLKPHGIGSTQYNVLRILRGAAAEGLCRNEIRDRLLTRMPDVTRLLDRMEEAGLVTRARGTEDRRLVATRLTKRGRDLVDQLDGPVAAEHQRRLGHLTAEQLQVLIQLLALARERV